MFEEMKLHRFLSTKIMTTIIRLSLIGMIVASFVGVGILSAQSSLVSKARPSARAKNTRRPARAAAAPTVIVVLVHGAFADGSSWVKVIHLLEAKGLCVTAVQNPLSSLADDVAATKRAIANQDGPVILVGHSWAGMVISEAGNDPKVAGLVYVAAIVPDENQSATDVLKPYSAFAQFLSIPKDAEDNKVSMTTKLTMPVLAIGGAKSFGANVAIVMRNAADNVTEVMIANSGHWLMEEQPTATIAAVHNFLDQKTTTQSH